MAVLATVIALLGSVSSAHFNPAVTVVEALRGRLTWRNAGTFTVIQVVGCSAGTLVAHVMFELPVWQRPAHIRFGPHWNQLSSAWAFVHAIYSIRRERLSGIWGLALTEAQLIDHTFCEARKPSDYRSS